LQDSDCGPVHVQHMNLVVSLRSSQLLETLV